MLCWGTVSMSMAAVTNGTGLLVTRFFLGLTEAVITRFGYEKRMHQLPKHVN